MDTAQTQKEARPGLIFRLNSLRRYLKHRRGDARFPAPDMSRDRDFPVIQSLRRNGYAVLEPGETVAAVPVARTLIDAYQSISGREVERIVEAGKNNVGRTYRKRLTSYFTERMLLDYALHPFFLSQVEQYFGFSPVLRYVAVWLDYPTRDDALETQMFHRDPEDIRLVKTFLYLKDVGMSNGPFTFAEGTHRNPWNSYRKIRHTDGDVRALYPTYCQRSFTGPAGTLVLADTNGFHKVLKPREGYRVMLTVNYCSHIPRAGHRASIFEPENPPLR